MSKPNIARATLTSDVFASNYVKVTSVDTLSTYHCTSGAASNASANDESWQVVRETIATGAMGNAMIGTECVADFKHKINTIAGLTGADVYLDTLTYWTP